MFWSEKSIQLRKKHLFVAEFINTNQSDRNGWSGTTNESAIKLLVKRIDAPSINLNFQRGLASNYVHYFQEGEINWEPINITFIDAVSIEQDEENTIPSWKEMFFKYLSDSPTPADAENRTGILDLPIFCSAIRIYSKVTFADYASDVNTKESSKLLTTDFVILNPRITKISFGSYEYGSDEANEITVTVIPEWCQYSNTNNIVDNGVVVEKNN